MILLGYKELKQSFWKYFTNFPGWRTNRKIVVIESDDWGSIRMPSKEVYIRCLKYGYPVHLNPYEKYDSLASKDDLELLFNLLLSFSDKNGRHPIFTANCVVANPNFDRIQNDNFQNYYFELITETFKKYPNHSDNFAIWKKGNEEGVFHPQFHAREHLNVSMFMKALQNNDQDVLFGFANNMPGCIRKGEMRNGNYFVEATKYDSEKDKDSKLEIYLNGLEIFNKLFGYPSLSIIPPNYTWSEQYNKKLISMNVKFIQGMRKMKEPMPGGKAIFKNRYLGQKCDQGLISLVRNVYFEPTLINSSNIVKQCLEGMKISFQMKKPAIISTHRINYVGHLDISNRDTNLKLLHKVLKQALITWPDIEFMTSDELGVIIEAAL